MAASLVTMASTAPETSSPLSKRRKFVPPVPPVMPCTDNSSIENHMFDSPLLPQLSSQMPTPEEIEASLFQVGMRVRKSVSEGYQTPQKKKFTPRPFANNLSRLSPETQQALLAGNVDQTNELSPYHAGGMHKVGSMAMQPIQTATFCGISLAALAYYSDDCSQPKEPEQTLWTYSTSHKRGYEADSDSDDSQDWLPETPSLTPEDGAPMPIDYFNLGMMDDDHDMQLGNRAARGRRIAQPRRRLRRQQEAAMVMPPSTANPFESMHLEHHPAQSYDHAPEQPFGHRRMLSCGMEASMDFGDAAFLQRREDVEMDCS